MGRGRLALILLLFGATRGAGASIENQLTVSQRRDFSQEAVIMMEYLQDYHYSDRPFFELDAAELLDRFADDLDYWRMTLTAADIAFIHRRFDRHLKAVYLFKGDLHPAYEIFDLFSKRAHARAAWIQHRLDQPFDGLGAKTYPVSRHHAEWPADEAAADDLWERRLASEVIAERLRGLAPADAVAEVRRVHADLLKELDRIDAAAVRERFLDTMLQTFDPHSGYFRRDVAADFEKELSTVGDGIGLDVEVRDDRVFVSGLDMGGPADRAGEVRIGDELLSVGDADAPPVTVAGRKRRQVLALLAGKPRTAVQLQVKTPGANAARTVSVVRERFAAVEYQARAALISVPDDSGSVAIGVISIPTFYGATGESVEGRTVSGDVHELVDKLRERGAQALVLDLRDNGGGLLDEAVKLTGLFLRTGPVAYVRGLDGKVETMRDDDEAVAFGGPIVILTSGATASASELFSGALQRYGRALVVGGDTTYGKGTAQAYIDLHALRAKTISETPNNWGLLRVTRQYYYLPDGHSPQLTGVHSDVAFADGRDWSSYREAGMPHALPSETIDPPVPLPVAATRGLATLSTALRGRLLAASMARKRDWPEFKLEAAGAELAHDYENRKELPLDLAQRRTQRDQSDAKVAGLRRDRRQLRAQLSYPGTTVDTGPVAEARQAHQDALRRRCDFEHRGQPTYFDGTTFYFESARGDIRDLQVDRIDFDAYRADAAALSDSWSHASGIPIGADEMTARLRDLDRWSDRHDRAVADVFRRHLPANVADDAIAAGIEAVFARMVALDPLPSAEHPPLDVVEREGLRLAADWVRWMPPVLQPPPSAKP